MSIFNKLAGLYSPASMLVSIRDEIKETPDKMAKKLNISPELYKCLENDEIELESLPVPTQARIESFVNVYFTTFRLNRQMAFKMFEKSTGMNKKFFQDKFEISERTFYSYLAGERIMAAPDIDRYLLIL